MRSDDEVGRKISSTGAPFGTKTLAKARRYLCLAIEKHYCPNVHSLLKHDMKLPVARISKHFPLSKEGLREICGRHCVHAAQNPPPSSFKKEEALRHRRCGKSRRETKYSHATKHVRIDLRNWHSRARKHANRSRNSQTNFTSATTNEQTFKIKINWLAKFVNQTLGHECI